MRTTPYSKALNHICSLIGVPISRLTTETADSINALFNSNVRQIWGAGNWPDISIWGEARFAGNLLTYANDLSQTSVWTATNVSVTANSINNPADNRVTANKVLETVTSAEHKVAQTISGFPSTDYQVSVYARPNGRDYIRLAVNDGATTFSAFFAIPTCAVAVFTFSTRLVTVFSFTTRTFAIIASAWPLLCKLLRDWFKCACGRKNFKKARTNVFCFRGSDRQHATAVKVSLNFSAHHITDA